MTQYVGEVRQRRGDETAVEVLLEAIPTRRFAEHLQKQQRTQSEMRWLLWINVVQMLAVWSALTALVLR